MHFCENCREYVRFYESNGQYYCSQCDCQSETMQVMEYSHFDSQPSQSFGMGSKCVKVKQKSEVQDPIQKDDTVNAKKDEVEDEGWSFAGVYQMILQSQVKALIKMGVTERLMEVTELLWFRFLCKSKWAFTGKQSKKLKKDKGGKAKKGKKSDPTQENTPGGQKKTMPEDYDYLKGNRTRRRTFRFRLNLLLGILYAALKFLDVPILISDLIRWILDGHLPYYATSDVIPVNISNQFLTFSTFNLVLARPDQMTFSKLQVPVSNLLDVLDVPIVPLDHDNVRLVVSRFITSLNLPVSFHQVTHYLLTNHLRDTAHPPQSKWGKKKAWEFEEGHCLAYVIIAIKLLLGLDGHTERMSSEIGRILRTVLPTDSQVVPFIWDEWMEKEKLRARQHGIHDKLFSSQLSRSATDVPRLIKQHSSRLLLDSKRESLYSKDRFKAKNLSYELQRPFMKLRDEDDQASSLPQALDGPRSFPYSSARPDERMEVETRSETSSSGADAGDSGNANGVHWTSKKDLAACDFTNTSIDYLLDLKKFCKKHGLDRNRVLNHERVKSRMAQKEMKKNQQQEEQENVGMSPRRDGKRKRTMDSESTAGRSAGGTDSEPAKSSSKKGKTKKKKLTHNEEDAQAECTISQSDLDELPYEEWKRAILSKTTSPDTIKPTQSKPCVETVRTHSVSYTQYKRSSFKEAKSRHRKEGACAEWTPFHPSYQWLLQHCAAQYGLTWMYVHEAVATVERQIFQAKHPKASKKKTLIKLSQH